MRRAHLWLFVFYCSGLCLGMSSVPLWVAFVCSFIIGSGMYWVGKSLAQRPDQLYFSDGTHIYAMRSKDAP